ncbi:cof-like hydrolase [Streptococcus urinalis FB127-CNA-2]|uniref:Cof-like hydrolase n=1 Tax=Streptococcus urinalis 2285-97 TaxID=764291 RepID=G5KEB0_9STRE|nr:Cof-type HAD-IIB family hydrolase [Streptococcus urinalis]EHJ56799.1 Cof-like hydrolase [Streptococcus urinalis 2285-97]EKS18239.1 cof-like hydrolase [Streptococcus urinalis FB127-CNA-2]VEF32887.1 haloacid dehalogenase family hydrolase [Streptococcus urinalis]
MKTKHIFLDMDGTLLNTKGRISADNAQLIRKANIPLTLVSARAPIEMKEAIDALNLDGLQVGFNGGLVYQYKDNQVHVIRELPLEIADTEQLLNYINQYFPHISQSYYTKDQWLTYKMDAGIDYESQLTLQEPTLIGEDLYLKPQKGVFKIMLIVFEPEKMAFLKESLLALDLPNVSIQQSGSYYLEITHREAKKSNGIDFIVDLENLPFESLAAFGDGNNDIPMFERVATPIAMQNAPEEIRVQAKHVTKTNDENGVGHGIHDFLLT